MAKRLINDTETKVKEFKDQLPAAEYKFKKRNLQNESFWFYCTMKQEKKNIRQAVSSFQQASLKLFEMAYKRCHPSKKVLEFLVMGNKKERSKSSETVIIVTVTSGAKHNMKLGSERTS
jgi:molecular chaperone DnaK